MQAKLDLISILIQKGIKSERLLNAIIDVSREFFIPEKMHKDAYKNKELIVTSQVTLPCPYVMALMIEAAEISIHQNVLEIGTGSGYQTAILSRLCKDVYSTEENEILAKTATSKLQKLGYKNIIICTGNTKAMIKRNNKVIICNHITNDYFDLIKLIKPKTILILQTAEGINRKILKIRKDRHGEVFIRTVAELPVEVVI